MLSSMSVMCIFVVFLMIRRPPRSTLSSSSAASDVYKRQPMGRLGTAEEIAAMAVYLASDDATFTTGTTISVDGGISI